MQMCWQVYPATTNPGVSTGDGQAMALRANARLAGMEFVQFHPTGFAGHTALSGQQTFLISEAVRGEGGHLLTLDGHRCAALHLDLNRCARMLISLSGKLHIACNIMARFCRSCANRIAHHRSRQPLNNNVAWQVHGAV